jgi:3-hydroxyacyl-[acyl-carrier-protein] dehydratase
MRYFLIDRIDELKRFHFAKGTKAIALSEDCFEHHFPGQPVFPGSLLIESMAQLGGALLEISLRDKLNYYPRCVLSSVKAKFREFARPGDTITFLAEVVSHHEDSAKVRATGKCGATPICEAELLFVYIRLDDPQLQNSRQSFLEVITRTTKFVEEI